jgi:glycosyltransferase involved in cell wall biosynthesis
VLDFSNRDAEICVIGRTSFQSGIGSIGYATAELLSRNFPVCFLPTEPDLRSQETVVLPNGRLLPVCKDPTGIKASFFCDVLWNGAHDVNYALTPAASLKYAWLVYDSDRLPARWSRLLNDHFDLVLAASPHLVETARANGVDSPIASVPIPLDLDPLLAAPLPKRDRDRVRFGCVAAFHPRKGMEVLVEAFLGLYAGRTDVELVLHSNLAFGPTLERVQALVAKAAATNVRISHGSLSENEKNELIRSLDVFVSCSRGEGYSIGPREALAYGKAAVLSAVGGHLDLAGLPGVFLVPTDVAVPARYPELDNLVLGQQHAVSPAAVARSLEAARAFVQSDQYDQTVRARRDFARDCSFSALSSTLGALVDPSITRFRRGTPPAHVSVPVAFERRVEARLGRRADSLGAVRRQVCTAYDAGFFSIFNAFMSHLVWQQLEERCHGVLPDWDVGRLVAQLGEGRVLSFCYGQPGDGNLWLKLFEPLYGATADEMQDPDWLWRHAAEPEKRHNEVREPLMTYVHAYRLYRSQEFAAWRRQYHRAFAQHVRLRPELAEEVDRFSADHLGAPFLIAAHVRHPSHTVEQPGAIIAHTEAYVRAIRDQIERRGLDPSGPGWGVFLATDQERVVSRFREEFGPRVACFGDVRRTRANEDAAFEALSKDEQNRDGHQLQHLVAADRANWSSRMAWEVVRDAFTMARCHCLLHVVSNVSTAVAYMNPDLDMVFCSA